MTKGWGIYLIISYNEGMFLVGLVSWWYGSGLVGQWQRMIGRFIRTFSFFSIGQLLATLFAPYRQIAASVGGDSFGQVIRGFFDQLVSRVIGAIVRFLTVIIGLIAIVFHGFVELLIVVAWVLLPLLPIAAALLFAIGWVPSWQ